MTCADFQILLCDLVDGTLPAEVQAGFERHRQECPGCAELAREVTGAVAFLGRVPAVDPPGELLTRLVFQAPKSSRPGLRSLLGRWFQPILQPRLVMGMAMTILSFSMLGRFASVPERQLQPSDLNPAQVWAAIDNRMHLAWERTVQYYENLRLVYEIQTRLREWSDEEERRDRIGDLPATPEGQPRPPQQPGPDQRSTNQ